MMVAATLLTLSDEISNTTVGPYLPNEKSPPPTYQLSPGSFASNPGDPAKLQFDINMSSGIMAIAAMVYQLGIVQLLLNWLESMQEAQKPQKHILASCQRTSNAMFYILPTLALLSIAWWICNTVLIWRDSLDLALATCVLICLAMLVLCGLIVWLWLDTRRPPSPYIKEYDESKRYQLVRLFGLSFFSALGPLLLGARVFIGSFVIWWVWYVIAVWPGMLLGFSDTPLEESEEGIVMVHPDMPSVMPPQFMPGSPPQFSIASTPPPQFYATAPPPAMAPVIMMAQDPMQGKLPEGERIPYQPIPYYPYGPPPGIPTGSPPVMTR